jgi:predicted ABC-type transport system involved in lysophospholipase L1 biosynthesis ATPase subunit
MIGTGGECSPYGVIHSGIAVNAGVLRDQFELDFIRRRDGAGGMLLAHALPTLQLARVSETMIETKDLHRSYRIGKKSIEVLHGIDLNIRGGERVFLCGPSGAGKTTLLYTLAGLERPERGSVRIHGADLYAMGRKEQARFRNREIGYVFQNFHLLPELTALENVAVPGAIAGRDSSGLAMKALERVGLADRAEHLPAELSGGEQQRVAIARAIVNEPKVLFADEPTGNLDSRNSAEIMEILMSLATEHGVTLVVVTHDRSLAEAGDRTLVIKDGSIHAA